MYDTYKERYGKITDALDKFAPNGCSYTKPGGGLNIWLGLHYGFPVNTLVNLAVENDIVFTPGRIFYSGNPSLTLNNIRLSFAAVHTDKIEAGIEKLCSLISGPSGN